MPDKEKLTPTHIGIRTGAVMQPADAKLITKRIPGSDEGNLKAVQFNLTFTLIVNEDSATGPIPKNEVYEFKQGIIPEAYEPVPKPSEPLGAAYYSFEDDNNQIALNHNGITVSFDRENGFINLALRANGFKISYGS